MAYIEREDGVRFVIPSYRDVLVAKQKNQLKRDVVLLSQNYGEYITLQKKSTSQFEVAFSPEPGYLLGETVWHHFKKPADLIYCEAIPNTTEAILVIVKSGSVYLDGRFPTESIPEELVIFLTQQNHFEIYVYGDVPISSSPEGGKFSFDPSSVKLFTELDQPVFPTLPLLKIYQLQLVDIVLQAQGIGVFPIRKVIGAMLMVGLLWMGWIYFRTQPEGEVSLVIARQFNPYQQYLTTLNSPAPDNELWRFERQFELLYGMPGWIPKSVQYNKGSFSAAVQSIGGSMQLLNVWARTANLKVELRPEGVFLTNQINLLSRPMPTKIYPIRDVMGTLVDRLASIYPGNNIKMGDFNVNPTYTDITFSIELANVTPALLSMIAMQLKGLPLVIQSISIKGDSLSKLQGSILIQALGS